MYALWFQRYMHRYGVTNEDLGRYTVVARKHAATNPNAWFYERPITLEDHQASRWIVEPILRKLDCCQESDGGVALIVTSMERARDLRQPPVRVAAASQSHLVDGDIMFNYHHADIADFPEARSLADQLWRVAGVTPADIDAAMIYENFSPVVLLQLEAFGFCGPGEAKDFIAEGHIEVGGSLPVNTHGGLLGEAYIHGVNNLLEGVRQIRGTAVNQVAGAEHVLVAAGRSAAVLARP
jgi:acetyl-CoA acetyltransferase